MPRKSTIEKAKADKRAGKVACKAAEGCGYIISPLATAVLSGIGLLAFAAVAGAKAIARNLSSLADTKRGNARYRNSGGGAEHSEAEGMIVNAVHSLAFVSISPAISKTSGSDI